MRTGALSHWCRSRTYTHRLTHTCWIMLAFVGDGGGKRGGGGGGGGRGGLYLYEYSPVQSSTSLEDRRRVASLGLKTSELSQRYCFIVITAIAIIITTTTAIIIIIIIINSYQRSRLDLFPPAVRVYLSVGSLPCLLFSAGRLMSKSLLDATTTTTAAAQTFLFAPRASERKEKKGPRSSCCPTTWHELEGKTLFILAQTTVGTYFRT